METIEGKNMPPVLDVAFFKPLLNQNFNIQLQNNTTLVVRLIEVTPTPQYNTDTSRESFAIVFRGPRDISIPQGMYSLEHETAETIEIFLVPIGPDEKGMCFEAVFN